MDSEDGSFEVSEPTTPPDHPPYWSDCERMTLPEMGRFIHDALLRRVQPSVPDDGSTPLTPQEFFDLVGLMQAKADELKEDTTMPARPVYDGPRLRRPSTIPPDYVKPRAGGGTRPNSG